MPFFKRALQEMIGPDEWFRMRHSSLFFSSNPNPMWVKRLVIGEDWPTMVDINDAYAKAFCGGSYQYIGKTDLEQFPEKDYPGVAKLWRLLDFVAYAEMPYVVSDIEPVPSDVWSTGFCKAYKRASFDPNDQNCVFIFGTCVELKSSG